MCKCISRFRSEPPELTLPANPVVLLCKPPAQLVSEFQAVETVWSNYVQNLLRALVFHQPPDKVVTHHTAIKKKKAPLNHNQRKRILELIAEGKTGPEIVAEVGCPIRRVWDLKYVTKRDGKQTELFTNAR